MSEDNVWSMIAGLGIIALWIRLYISCLRIEKNTKSIAEVAVGMRSKAEERERAEAAEARAAMRLKGL